MPTKAPANVGLYLPPDVIRLTRYPMTTRVIFAEVLALAATGRTCTPSNAHFAARFGLSADTVSRALRELEAAGLLIIDQDPQTGHNRTLAPAPTAAPSAADSAATPPQIAAPHPPQTAEGYPTAKSGTPPQNAEGGAAKSRGAAAKSRTEGSIEVRREEDHPTLAAARPVGGESSKVKSETPAAPPRRTTAPAEPPGFAAFYDGWPNKQKRRDAAKAFAALAPDDQQLAAERATKWLREHPCQIERGACPFPATWLRGAMWTDGPEPPDRSPKTGQPATPTTARTAARTAADDTIKRQREGNWK